MLKLTAQLADPGFKLKPAFSSQAHTLSHVRYCFSAVYQEGVPYKSLSKKHRWLILCVYTYFNTNAKNILTSIILRCISTSIFSYQTMYPLGEENHVCIFPLGPRCHFTMLKDYGNELNL